MTPAPMMTTRLLMSVDAPAERVFFVEQQGRLCVHEGRAGDDGRYLSCVTVQPAKLARERASNDAFLNPRFAFNQLTVSGKAGELRARAGAAGRAVVGFAGTLDEVARVCTRGHR